MLELSICGYPKAYSYYIKVKDSFRNKGQRFLPKLYLDMGLLTPGI